MKENTLHVENGQYKTPHTGTVYDHFDDEDNCGTIDSILGTEFDQESGKLMVIVRWDDGQQPQIEVELLQRYDISLFQ
jgi:hypothetical protein